MTRFFRSVQLILACAIAAAVGGCGSDSSAVTVSGTVTGLTGTLILTNNGADPLTVSADGRFVFARPITTGTGYAVTVQTDPVGQICTISSGSGFAGADVTDVAVTCVTQTRSLGGTVSGLTGSLVLQSTGGLVQAVGADGAFSFDTPVAQGTPYIVTVKTQPNGQTCTVSQGSGVVGATDITSVTVVCTALAHTAGGALSGLIGTVVLQNNGGDTLSLSSDGAFAFATPVLVGRPYAVTVQTQPAAQTCSVTNGSGTMGSAKVSNVAVVCSINSYAVGGTVSGLAGTLILQDNGGDAQTIAGNGVFTFATPVAQGGSYAVTVQTQPATQTCSVGNGSGTMAGANVTNVSVICAANTFTVGGTVSGLSGSVVLQDNGTDTSPISSNGAFTFPTPIAEGSTYSVTVQTQPAEQSCTVVNGSGILGASNVTNVGINCVTNDTTLSVAASGIIPVNGATAGLVVTNTGSAYTAFNVSAVLPGGWTGVTQDASGCATLAPQATCTLTFASTTAYVAQGNITVTGDNIASPPTTALAFSVSGYLVFGVPSSTTAAVIASSDVYEQWSPAMNNVPGISENSTVANGAACDGASDGSCDTAQILAMYGASSNYAAGACSGTTADNSGPVSAGTWYLPAICELGGAAEGANCPVGLANIETNLAQLGFGGLNGVYWSATEMSANPNGWAWFQYLPAGGGGFQDFDLKFFGYSVRCARAISY